MSDIRGPISYFDQVLGKRESQTWQVFNFRSFLLVQNFAKMVKKRENLIPLRYTKELVETKVAKSIVKTSR